MLSDIQAAIVLVLCFLSIVALAFSVAKLPPDASLRRLACHVLMVLLVLLIAGVISDTWFVDIL